MALTEGTQWISQRSCQWTTVLSCHWKTPCHRISHFYIILLWLQHIWNHLSALGRTSSWATVEEVLIGFDKWCKERISLCYKKSSIMGFFFPPAIKSRGNNWSIKNNIKQHYSNISGLLILTLDGFSLQLICIVGSNGCNLPIEFLTGRFGKRVQHWIINVIQW